MPGVPTGQSSPVSNLSASAKPRLVAKSALGGLGSRPGMGSASTGPDTNTVWNKNKRTCLSSMVVYTNIAAVQAPVPRQFTDEELKQHYGIHMATRLPADEAGKESKWADLDDDDEDWAAPEIKWMDGTTSTIPLTQGEEQILEKEPELQQPVAPELLPELVPASITGGNRMVLKPGSYTGMQHKSSGNLILKPGADRKGGAQQGTPAKSPWASLPPVDKASPVQFVPPMAQPHLRFARDPGGFEAFANAAPSPKEIAADDFNRVWQSEQPRNKELYIPQSGRFESVNDNRRGPQRGGDNQRQPAVLQRPPHQNGPAEPSAAFQTSRSAGDGPSWQRHRTGSMSSSGRRMSFGRSSEMSASPHHEIAQLHGQRPWTRTSPAMTFAQPVQDHEETNGVEPGVEAVEAVVEAPVEPSAPMEDPVAVQQRLMREKIERARAAKQRRLEDEMREEQAKQERLKAKMEALAAATSPPSMEAKESRLKQSSPARSPQRPLATQVASPPKPPVPTAEGEVAQYGMMKVHQPHPVKRQQGPESLLQHAGDGHRRPHADMNAQRSNGRMTAGEKAQYSTSDPSRGQASNHSADNPWKALNLADNLSGWSSSNTSNVWAPPQTKDRALGNGTFDSGAYGRPAAGVLGASRSLPHVTSAQNPAGPGPIAPPLSANAHQSHRPQQPAQSQTGDSSHASLLNSQAPLGRPQTSDMSSRIAQSTGSATFESYNQDANLPNLGAWGGNYREIIAQREATMEQASHEALQDSRRNPQPRVYHETYVDRRPGEKAGEYTIVNVTKTTHVEGRGAAPNASIQPGQAGYQGPVNLQMTAPTKSKDVNRLEKTQSGQSLAKSSRFFPRAGQAQSSEKSDSPPPPDFSSLDTSEAISSPVVNLPKPVVVRLPPSRPAADRAGPPSPIMARPSSSSNWQSKIDNLLRVGKPGEIPALVNTSSRAPLDVTVSHYGATVSLPLVSHRAFAFATDFGASPATGILDEELFELPEFGSTPRIFLPRFVSAAASQPPVFQSNVASPWRGKEWTMGTSKPVFDIVEAYDGPHHGDIKVVIRMGPNAEPAFVPYHLVSRNGLGRGGRGRGLRSRARGDLGHTSTPRRASGQSTTRDAPVAPSLRGGLSLRGRPTRGAFTRGRNISAPVSSASPA
jgi:hypothetical protein